MAIGFLLCKHLSADALFVGCDRLCRHYRSSPPGTPKIPLPDALMSRLCDVVFRSPSPAGL